MILIVNYTIKGYIEEGKQMRNSLKAFISLSVVVLIVIIMVIYRIVSSTQSLEITKNAIGTAEQVADKRITDAKILADKKIEDAKILADKKIADAKASETKKVSDAKAAEDKKISDEKAQSGKSKKTEYKSYHNEKFSYSINYPNSLKIEDGTANGNMIKSDDGKVSLQMYGNNNAAGDTSDSIYNKAIKDTNMYYKVHAGNWFVISYIEGDKIIYQKKVVGKGSTNTFIFKFPANEKDKYTNVVSALEKSFKTSSTDKAH